MDKEILFCSIISNVGKSNFQTFQKVQIAHNDNLNISFDIGRVKANMSTLHIFANNILLIYHFNIYSLFKGRRILCKKREFARNRKTKGQGLCYIQAIGNR